MKTKMRSLFVLLGLCAGLVFVNLSGLGGCGSSSSGGGSSSGTGEASVASLSTVPSLDVSNLDYSGSSSASSLVVKNFGEGTDETGQTSRAGCEADMHKKEIVRLSQQVQLDRCYPEAMEAAGLMTIPTGSYALYDINPPERSDEERTGFCDDIPEEFTEERAACEAGGEGPADQGTLLRLGRIDGALHVDICQGEQGSGTLVSESTYNASGSVYTIAAVRSGTWGGHEEAARFDITVDLGTDGSVADGLVDLGATGTATANGRMNGAFGSGLISFAADASDTSNTVSGAFAGGYTDPSTSAETSFTGRVYTRFGGASNTGSAIYSFTGSMPPFLVGDMIPYDISTDQQDEFLSSLSAELGIELAVDSLLCPNPNFAPESTSDDTVKPMIAASDDGTCPEVTHTGIESFSITNGTTTGDYGDDVTQIYTIIEDAASEFFDEVSDFDLSTLDPTAGTIAFSRNWDCTGSFTTLDFVSVTPAQEEVLREAVQVCNELEEKARGNEGMGGYNCGEQEQQNSVDDFADEGGPTFGPYGGEYAHNAALPGNTCSEDNVPPLLYVNAISVDEALYCLPTSDGSSCEEFAVVSNAAVLDEAIDLGGLTITNISYAMAGEVAESALIQFGGLSACNGTYSITQPTFEAPPEGGEGGEGGPPEACIAAFGDDVTEDECEALCSQPDSPCDS